MIKRIMDKVIKPQPSPAPASAASGHELFMNEYLSTKKEILAHPEMTDEQQDVGKRVMEYVQEALEARNTEKTEGGSRGTCTEEYEVALSYYREIAAEAPAALELNERESVIAGSLLTAAGLKLTGALKRML